MCSPCGGPCCPSPAQVAMAALATSTAATTSARFPCKVTRAAATRCRTWWPPRVPMSRVADGARVRAHLLSGCARFRRSRWAACCRTWWPRSRSIDVKRGPRLLRALASPPQPHARQLLRRHGPAAEQPPSATRSRPPRLRRPLIADACQSPRRDAERQRPAEAVTMRRSSSCMAWR